MYVSVFGDERGKKVAISGLKSKVKYVRSALAKRMKLRLTPEIRFIEDDSIERGSRVTLVIWFFLTWFLTSYISVSLLMLEKQSKAFFSHLP